MPRHYALRCRYGIRDPTELENNPYDDYSFTFAQPFK